MQKIKNMNGLDEDDEISGNPVAVCQWWTAFSILHFICFADPNMFLSILGIKFCNFFGGFYIWESCIALFCESTEGFRLNEADNTILNYSLIPIFDSRSSLAPIGHSLNLVMAPLRCCCRCCCTDLFSAPIGYHHATEKRGESSGWWNLTGGTINPDEERFCR